MTATLFSLGITGATLMGTTQADEGHEGGLASASGGVAISSFDIVHTRISTEGNSAVFRMEVSAQAGQSKPTATGQLAGSDVFSYVWPTTLDSYQVGFEREAGILALAVTAHPDFDDTPLFDENGDGDTGNDGNVWHSHWVVLQPNEACGEGALGVVDIAEGEQPRLPSTWPGLPILLDSPGWQPIFTEQSVEVRVAFADIEAVNQGMFDGVTAGLRVNESAHAPLLCVVDVMDVASGDLSLPGRVNH
ncbi:hypothetical protein BG841_13125 [Marinobacter sp. X15-166B]|nr:hypothetical protein BG841_13125 [Marinobacter sp. X15-166B]